MAATGLVWGSATAVIASSTNASAGLNVLAAAHASPVLSIQVQVRSPVLNAEPIVDIFARRLSERCGAEVLRKGDAPLKVTFALRSNPDHEGFEIADAPDGAIRISGNDWRGLLYGVGKFLRTSRYTQNGFIPGSWRGSSSPVCTVRGIYFATHFGNFYESAPAEETSRYVDDLALWGVNALIVHFPHWQFESFEDPAARGMLDRLKAILRAAKKAGMGVGLVEAANHSFKSSPKDLRNTPVPDALGRHGNFGVNLCPAKAAARALLLRDWQRLLDEFADVELDYLLYWPYDEGGCGCSNCSPWGARGYPELCRELSVLSRIKYPKIRFILSTWTFDTPPAGEWEGLATFLNRDHAWTDYLMADAHEDFPRYPLEHTAPGGLPLLNFPEISMWGQTPWGGFGANPLPSRLQRLWHQTRNKLSGGFPYSEGIYEDINKVICSQLYWRPDQPVADTVKEYIAFEFSPEVVAEVWAAIQILEQNHQRSQVAASTEAADKLLREAEIKLAPQVRAAWRWRTLRVRALIDHELFKHQGRFEGYVLQEAFDELTRLYHAEAAHSMPVHPPQVKGGKPPRTGQNP